MREMFEWIDECSWWQIGLFSIGIIVVYIIVCLGIGRFCGLDDDKS